MDTGQQVQLIEGRLDALEHMQVSDDQSAREALTHVMVTVIRMNQLSAQAHAQALMGAGAPADDVLGKLGEWLDRLVGALTRIVGKLAGARSFSVSAGSNVSVTVDFGQAASSSAAGQG
jgi:hypothetical protein